MTGIENRTMQILAARAASGWLTLLVLMALICVLPTVAYAADDDQNTISAEQDEYTDEFAAQDEISDEFPAEEASPANPDPLEFINRPIWHVNDFADRYVLRPAGKGYNFIVPKPARTGIGNFFDNITYPVTIVNALLQGKGRQAWEDTLRFVINSTFGLLGFMDLATGQGLVKHDEDFGQTFAVWGIPSGPYIVLPLLGPSTVRDGVGILGNVQVNPLIQMNNTSVRDKLLILWAVETRAALIGPDKMMREAYDPYIFMRDAFLQNRKFLILDKDINGDTESDEYFEDYEEFEEDF